MQRFFIFSICVVLLSAIAVTAPAQQAASPSPASAKGVEGRWTGNFQVPNGGEMEMVATFKKEKDAYTGAITIVGMSEDRPLKSVSVDGDQVKARAEFEGPNGGVLINYTFTLKDDALKGKGELELGGQHITFDVNLKRATEK
jgi:hypothetical protein